MFSKSNWVDVGGMVLVGTGGVPQAADSAGCLVFDWTSRVVSVSWFLWGKGTDTWLVESCFSVGS